MYMYDPRVIWTAYTCSISFESCEYFVLLNAVHNDPNKKYLPEASKFHNIYFTECLIVLQEEAGKYW